MLRAWIIAGILAPLAASASLSVAIADVPDTASLGVSVEIEPLPHSPAIPLTNIYPAEAKRLNQSGLVTLIYSVGADGKAVNVVATGVASESLRERALAILKERRYSVPADWVTSGGAAKRYRLDLIFQLSRSPKISPVEGVRDWLLISSNSIPGR